MAVVELENVTKRFEDVTAVEDLSLAVEEGEIYGFLGSNGAGKTTTINLLLDFVRPSHGRVSVFGRDVTAESTSVRHRTGILAEDYGVYERLTGREHVSFAAATKDAEDDPAAVLERVGLRNVADRRAGSYSKGMRQRLALAMALVGSPELLVLDEPSSGLDPNGGRRFRRLVREERDRGATVFLSSHLLEEVQALCDRVGILSNGRLIAEGTVDELLERTAVRPELMIRVEEMSESLPARLREVDGVADATASPDRGEVEVRCIDGASKYRALSAVVESSTDLVDFETSAVPLTEAFRRITRSAKTKEDRD
jgi:ABC-2 type transport system ATP-binding protein